MIAFKQQQANNLNNFYFLNYTIILGVPDKLRYCAPVYILDTGKSPEYYRIRIFTSLYLHRIEIDARIS